MAAEGLPDPGRFPFSRIDRRPAFDWPGGARLAVYVAVNCEHFAWGEGLGAELVPGHGQPDVLNWAWREYGNRVGVWRLLDLFEEMRLPAAGLLNAAICDHCPEVAAAFRERGHEIVAHGRSNAERQGDKDEAAERELIAQTTCVLAAASGAPPQGWLGPWISESRVTPDLLAEAGYRYTLDWCMDDQPVWLATRAGRLLAVPYPQEVNDIPAIVSRKMETGAFCAMLVDQFEEMLAQSRRMPLVMGIALHPYVFGQPFRLRALRRALSAITGRPGVWWTVPGAIAAHVSRVAG